MTRRWTGPGRWWHRLGSVRARAAFSAALATLVIFGGGGYLVRAVIGRHLERQAVEQAKKNANLLAIRVNRGSHGLDDVPSYAGDELTSLAVTINATLDRLQHALAEQRRFVSDASHELRSPLASLRSSLEVALAHPDRSDRQAVVTAALTDTERIQQLTDDLLVLAHVDHATPASGVVDLAGMVAEQMAERAHTTGPASPSPPTSPNRSW